MLAPECWVPQVLQVFPSEDTYSNTDYPSCSHDQFGLEHELSKLQTADVTSLDQDNTCSELDSSFVQPKKDYLINS